MRNSSSPFHYFVPLSFRLSVLLFTRSLPVLSNSSRPRAVLKSFLQTLQISFTIYLALSFFISFDSWPTSFRRKKPKANRKLMKSENVVAFSLLCFCYVLFFFSSPICCCRCWFCSIAKHILVTDLFFCSLFSLPACCYFFCVLFVFHFLKFRLLLLFLLPPPPVFIIL